MADNVQNSVIKKSELESGFGVDKNGIDEKIQNLLESNNEIYEIRQHIIKKKLVQIESNTLGINLRAMVPSLILLFLSIFVDISYVPILGEVARNLAEWIFPGVELLNQGVSPIQFWWLPFAAYLVFVFTAYMSNRELKNEITQKGASENSISRIIEKYSGVVDGIGTALPLLGAAILLVSIKEGPTIFLGFSVPFEVKAIMVLAIAKLFDSVFSAQAVQYQEVQEELNKIEKEYYASKEGTEFKQIAKDLKDISRRALLGMHAEGGSHLSKEQLEEIYQVVKATDELNEKFTNNLIKFKDTSQELSKINLVDPRVIEDFQKVTDTMSSVVDTVKQSADYSELIKENIETVSKIVAEINNVKMPDEKLLKELQVTAHFIGETLKNLNDSSAAKGLDNLAYLAGKRH